MDPPRGWPVGGGKIGGVAKRTSESALRKVPRPLRYQHIERPPKGMPDGKVHERKLINLTTWMLERDENAIIRASSSMFERVP